MPPPPQDPPPQDPPPRTEMVTFIVDRMCAEEVEDDRSTEAVEAFRHVARWIARSISPFLDMDATMCAALPSDDPVDEIDAENFNRIMKMHRHFPELISAFKEQPDAYASFVAIMARAMKDARSQDTNLIRYEIATFIPLNYKTESVMPPITGGEKSGRGFSHPATGKLLCPLRYLDRFQADRMLFKNEVENGKIKLRASDERNWPSFLYPEGTVYNALELENGLFRGHVFLRGLRAIYTGKSSAFTGHRSASKPSQAEMRGMRELFPEAVAYAAVQCYYGLSSLEGWDTEDRYFKLDVFFDKCVCLFTEDPEDEWVVDTFKFLTSQMPALIRKTKRRLMDASEDEEESGDERPAGILAQRAARREAAREAEQVAQQSRPDNTDPNNEDSDPRPPTPQRESPLPPSPVRGRPPSQTSSPPSRRVRLQSKSPASSRSSSPGALPRLSSTSNSRLTMNQNHTTHGRVPRPSNEGGSSNPPLPPPQPPQASTSRGEHEAPRTAPKKNSTRKAKRPRTNKW